MFLTSRFYILLLVIVVLSAVGYQFPATYTIALVLLCMLVIGFSIDCGLLWFRRGMTAFRKVSDRLSNGDDNDVVVRVENGYPFPVWLNVIDEIPVVFQKRNVNFKLDVKAGEGKDVKYTLRPVSRGDYSFGRIRVFVTTLLGLVERRYTLGEEKHVKVYPSFLMLTRYELLAVTHNLTEFGIKKIRRIGNNTEFEEIKDYVIGDDYRRINWKATARKSNLMVNVYQDERSQQIFSAIDKGRVMQQAFNGMTLFDYAINASLVLSFVAINKGDKAGLVTFGRKFDTLVPASRHKGQMQCILEALYDEKTRFGETDFSSLVAHVNQKLVKRSLFVLYTNFLDMQSMKRQLPYFLQLNKRHRLLVVFFEDEELNKYVEEQPESLEEYYQHVIGDKFRYEKQLIVSTLKQYGILSLLTTPQNLSIDVINKYLELKSRNLVS